MTQLPLTHPKNSVVADSPSEDDVLRHMLSMPPQPRKPAKPPKAKPKAKAKKTKPA